MDKRYTSLWWVGGVVGSIMTLAFVYWISTAPAQSIFLHSGDLHAPPEAVGTGY